MGLIKAALGAAGGVMIQFTREASRAEENSSASSPRSTVLCFASLERT